MKVLRNVLEKITQKLDKERIDDYEVNESIPRDVVSIDLENGQTKIYIPEDYDYAQYEIDDFLRSKSSMIRTTTETERDITVMKVDKTLTINQIYDLIKFIIKNYDFCNIKG